MNVVAFKYMVAFSIFCPTGNVAHCAWWKEHLKPCQTSVVLFWNAKNSPKCLELQSVIFPHQVARQNNLLQG